MTEQIIKEEIFNFINCYSSEVMSIDTLNQFVVIDEGCTPEQFQDMTVQVAQLVQQKPKREEYLDFLCTHCNLLEFQIHKLKSIEHMSDFTTETEGHVFAKKGNILIGFCPAHGGSITVLKLY